MNEDKRHAKVAVHIPNLNGDAIGQTYYVSVPVTLDPHTGEELLTEEAIETIEATKARYMGLLMPQEIKEMREQLGMTQQKISELVQAGDKSWTRWETGKARPSRMINVLLRLIYEGKVFLSDLIAQRDSQNVDWRKNCCPKSAPPQQYVLLATSTQIGAQASLVGPTGFGPPPPVTWFAKEEKKNKKRRKL
jgi:DNA-binding transcriptional regulator YiaG